MDRNNNWEGGKIGCSSTAFEEVGEKCLGAVETRKTVNSLPPNDQQTSYDPRFEKK